MVRRGGSVMIYDGYSIFKDSAPQGWQVAPLLCSIHLLER
jgi:hypothetical protein